MSDNIVELKSIMKRFPGVLALEDVDFIVKRGEVHGLVGENGAGKSTLLKVLSGLYKRDAGSVVIDKEEVEDLDVAGAIHRGIRMLAQNPEVLPTLSVAENIFIEDLPLRRGFLDNAKMYKLATEALERIDINLDPRARMETLTFLQQKIVLLARALWYGVKILILDEPTASLTAHEIGLLFTHVRELNKMGTTVIYVSHYLEEVFEICDKVTILREGKKVVTDDVKNMDINQLVRYMIGKDINLFPKLDHNPGKKVLEVKNMFKKGMYSDISFSVREGEIVCLAGIKGSGKEDVIDGLFGFTPCDSGDIYIDGEKLSRVSGDTAFEKGILLLPADRLMHGLFLNQAVRNSKSPM